MGRGWGWCLESFPQAWFYVLRNNRPQNNFHFLPSCYLLPTPEAARPAPHSVSTPQLPPSDPLCLLHLLGWGGRGFFPVATPLAPESYLDLVPDL